ncbi:MAG: ABC transporter permease [Prevotellaceae bacterium]|jgi:putative ABC transport system permease protein|nr:ABC transporter permease [Prevotellaceae bacterium]
MRLILRNFIFVLKRFKVSSILNILGLSVAFAVFFVVVIQAHYDFGFDENFEKADNIYLISKYLPHRGTRWSTTNTMLSKMIAEKYPEVKNYCFTNNNMNNMRFDVKDATGDSHKFESPVLRASEGILDMFTPKIIAGDARQAFTEPNKVMLTKSVAQKFFGKADPLGKTFTPHYGTHSGDILFTVVAVCEDFPENCSLTNGVYMMQPEDVDSEWSYISYLEIGEGDRDKILNGLNSDESLTEQNGERGWVFELTALPDIHLKFPATGKGSLNTTLSLLAIGILLLIIAYINFINFSVSMAPVRLKGLNIRRILGESAFLLKFSIVMEAVFISLIAVVISLFFVHYFGTSVVREFFQADISLSKNIGLYPLMACLALILGLVAGLYPAFYSTAFKPAMALSGSYMLSMGSKILKNTLIIIQFSSAVLLVTVSGFIKIQHDYMQDKSWGIRKDNVAYLPAYLLSDVKAFEIELKKNPDIIDFTYSAFLPGTERMMTWGRSFEGTGVNMAVWPVSHNYLRFFGINIVEGSDFEEGDMQGKGKMIFNRTFVKKYGFTELVGKEIEGFSESCEIIGIMEDFNFESLRAPVRPIAFVTGKNYTNGLGAFLVRINGANTRSALDYMQALCKQFSSEPVKIGFLDEELHKLYKQENNLAKLISIFGLITILVTVMGVYGLILFNVKSKRKTIAIHKINGASVKEVILMLNRGFILQFLIAYIIAVPLAYIIVNRWLENFAYKTAIHWWMFILSGVLVFVIVLITVSYQSYKAATANPVDGIKAN